MANEEHLGEQFQLFDTAPYEVKPPTDKYDPANWANDDATVWHSTLGESSPHTTASIGLSEDYAGFHVGTLRSADEATKYSRRRRNRAYPYRMTGSSALDPMFAEHDVDPIWRDTKANQYYANEEYGGTQSPAYAANARGEHVPYRNESEDEGSVSFRAAPEHIMTWSEHVLSDPDAPAHWRDIAQTHELVAHVGKPQYKRSERDEITHTQEPLPGIGTYNEGVKHVVARPSAPPSTPVVGKTKDYEVEPTWLREGRTVTPQHQYLTFEPKKKGRRRG